jgi:amino acid transporter
LNTIANLHRRKHNGHSIDELPFRAAFGVWGSYIGLLIAILCLIAQFYVALYPIGGPNLDAELFFQAYLAGPFLVLLYLMWKVYSWFARPSDRPFFIRTKDIDIYSGMREEQMTISGEGVAPEYRRASVQDIINERQAQRKGVAGHAKAFVRALI